MAQHLRILEAADDGPHTAEAGAARTSLGLRGAWRLTYLVLVLALFAARVWINRRGWFGRRTISPSDLRHHEGVVLRDKLITLGPTFIKLGQTLAMRLDLLPVEYLQTLARLQDAVPPFSTTRARTIIAQELGASPETLFARFDPVPVASASLGQVYRARLHTGQDVAVKVQRPGLVDRIEVDLAVLRCLIRGLERLAILPRGLDWLGMLGEFRATILIELDFVQEAQHAAIFRKHFASWRDVYVPRFYPELSTSRVLVMEYITGFAVGVSAAYGRFRMTEFDVAGARSPQSANRLLTILVAGHIYHAGQRLGKTPDDGGTRMIIDSLLSGVVALSLLMVWLRVYE